MGSEMCIRDRSNNCRLIAAARPCGSSSARCSDQCQGGRCEQGSHGLVDGTVRSQGHHHLHRNVNEPKRNLHDDCDEVHDQRLDERVHLRLHGDGQELDRCRTAVTSVERGDSGNDPAATDQCRCLPWPSAGLRDLDGTE